MKIELIFKKNLCGALENTSGDMGMLSDLQLIYMVSIEILPNCEI